MPTDDLKYKMPQWMKDMELFKDEPSAVVSNGAKKKLKKKKSFWTRDRGILSGHHHAEKQLEKLEK